jgi:LPXTG-motif cell wall-anchored protein
MAIRFEPSRIIAFLLALAAALAIAGMAPAGAAAQRSECPGGSEPIAWEDNATTMVCPGGVRLKGTPAGGRTQLAQTGFELELIALAGAACMAGGLVLLRRRA